MEDVRVLEAREMREAGREGEESREAAEDSYAGGAEPGELVEPVVQSSVEGTEDGKKDYRLRDCLEEEGDGGAHVVLRVAGAVGVEIWRDLK